MRAKLAAMDRLIKHIEGMDRFSGDRGDIVGPNSDRDIVGPNSARGSIEKGRRPRSDERRMPSVSPDQKEAGQAELLRRMGKYKDETVVEPGTYTETGSALRGTDRAKEELMRHEEQNRRERSPDSSQRVQEAARVYHEMGRKSGRR